MPFVPEDKRTTVWYLLEPKFTVRIPQQAQRTVEDIKLFGTPTSGDEFVDKEIAKNPVMCMLSIAAMEDIFHRGYDVGVVNYDDTKRIYEYVTNHLVAFRNLFLTSENINPDPEFLDELIRLDKFAAAVYGPAKHVMGGDLVHSLLARRMKSGGLGSLSRNTLLKQQTANAPAQPTGVAGMRDYSTNQPVQAPAQQIDQTEEDSKYPQRISLQSMFERQKRLGHATWK